MTNIKISALRKELDIDSKEMLAILEQNNIKDKKAQSSLNEDELNILIHNKELQKAILKLYPSLKDEIKSDSPKKEDKKETKNDIKEEKSVENNSEKPKKKLVLFRPENTKNADKATPKQPTNKTAGIGLLASKLKPSQIAMLRKEREERKKLENINQENIQKVADTKKEDTKVNDDVSPKQNVKPEVAVDESLDKTQEVVDIKPIVEIDERVEMPSNKDIRGGKNKRKNDSKSGNKNNEQHKNKRKTRKDQQIFDDEDKHRKQKPVKKVVEVEEEEELVKLIQIPETLTIQELADKMKIKPSRIVKDLFVKGTVVTINQEIEYQMAENIAIEYDVLVEPIQVEDLVEKLLEDVEDDEKDLVQRPPVVCVMGHVDHGKTSLLDAIRNTNIIDKEAGGITQHIGAYMVECHGRPITFLDTPGHEAFTSMRLRGAKSTDIAILVVAADDGVMPQTVEAINHAKAAGIEIIVAINKIDKPGANPEKVKQELSEYDLIPEEWGGSTIFCPVSAKQNQGIDSLLEMVILTADILELKANPNRNSRGIIIEAKIDKGRGPVATVLVQKGTLNKGDNIACGGVYGKVRAMIDNHRKRIEKATPSMPVEILGLNGVPKAGDTFIVYDTEKDARNFADTYNAKEKINKLAENKSRLKMSLDELYDKIQEGELKELCLIIKGDVQGSVEAIRQSLEKLSNDEVVVKIIHRAVGAVNESDVSLASASNAIILGFNVSVDAIASENAKLEGVDIRLYNVIYNAIDDVEKAMKGMLEPEFEEEVTGYAEVRQTFKASGIGVIAGCYVTDGIIEKNSKARITRDDNQIFDGNIISLKRFQDDVKEVKSGFECGLVFEDFSDIKEGDIVEVYKMVEKARN